MVIARIYFVCLARLRTSDIDFTAFRATCWKWTRVTFRIKPCSTWLANAEALFSKIMLLYIFLSFFLINSLLNLTKESWIFLYFCEIKIITLELQMKKQFYFISLCCHLYALSKSIFVIFN